MILWCQVEEVDWETEDLAAWIPSTDEIKGKWLVITMNPVICFIQINILFFQLSIINLILIQKTNVMEHVFPSMKQASVPIMRRHS